MTGPLAYVFWHRHALGVDSGSYEAALARFQQALRASEPAGLRRSFSLRTSGIPWLGDGGSGYEDWYLLDSSCALDEINAAAVGPAAAGAHEIAARSAAEGVAGLYRLYAGSDRSAERSGTARWLDLPGDDAAVLAAAIGEGGGDGVWRRQMTLGPSPEFCVLLAAPAPLDELAAALSVERSLLAG